MFETSLRWEPVHNFHQSLRWTACAWPQAYGGRRTTDPRRYPASRFQKLAPKPNCSCPCGSRDVHRVRVKVLPRNAKAQSQRHRGRSINRTTKPQTSHRATAVNQVWMRDITWLPVKGLFYYLYLVLDLFSRNCRLGDLGKWISRAC